MNDNKILELLESITVDVNPKRIDGRGVIVDNQYVFTATHCLLNFSFKGMAALDDGLIQRVKFLDGSEAYMNAVFADPISDLAILAAVDDQSMPDDFTSAQSAMERVGPVEVCWSFRRTKMAYLRNVDGTLVSCTSDFWGENTRKVFLESSIQVHGGASGGPIVNSNGELLAVASTFSERNPSDGLQPIIAQCLPAWLAKVMRPQKQ